MNLALRCSAIPYPLLFLHKIQSQQFGNRLQAPAHLHTNQQSFCECLLDFKVEQSSPRCDIRQYRSCTGSCPSVCSAFVMILQCWSRRWWRRHLTNGSMPRPKPQVHLQYALGRQVQTPRSCTVPRNLLMRNQTSWEMPVKVDAYQQDRE